MRDMVVVLCMLSACGDDGGAAAIDAPVAIDAPACAGGKTVFLNRGGGTFTPGPNDDASTNTTPVAGNMTRTLAAFPFGDPSWTAVKQCVVQGLAPFNVTVTDVDPGAARHHEIVVSTRFWDAGNQGVRSISTFTCPSAGLPASGIAFVFAEAIGDMPGAICDDAVSQLASAVAGLDHSRDCKDFLGTFQPACGMRSFLDREIACGEQTDRPCSCGGMTQNSFRGMSAALCQ